MPFARIGDRCSCQRKGHGDCVIVAGDPDFTIDDVLLAYDWYRTSCGAAHRSTLPDFSLD